jgi:hypothetical protein
MNLKPGMTVWLPCEVKPGPFSNERAVRIESSNDSWIGFVDVRFLREPVSEGMTYVRALIVAVEQDRFHARLPGHSVGPQKVFQGDSGKVNFDLVPA